MTGEIVLAIVTALGSLFGIIMFVMKRRDKRREEVAKRADEAKDMFEKGIKGHDDSATAIALSKLKRMRRK